MSTAHAAEYESYIAGVTLDFGFAAGPPGDTLLGDVGGRTSGVRTFRERAVLLSWDGFVGIRAGILGNTHPYTPLVGMRLQASLGAGYRALRRDRFALYAGGRAGLGLDVLTRPGTSISDLNKLNNVDGVAGVVAAGDLRAELGMSFLDGPHSVLLVGFFRELLRAPGIYTPGMAFSGGGVGLRYDFVRRWTVEVDVAAGRTPPRTDAGLGTTVDNTRAEMAILLRKIWSNGVWLDGNFALSREFSHRTYVNPPATFDTADGPAVSVAVGLGVSLDRAHFRGGSR